MENAKKKVVEFQQYREKISLSVSPNGKTMQCLNLPPTDKYPEGWDINNLREQLKNKPIRLVRVDGFETKGYFEDGLIFEKSDEYGNTRILNSFTDFSGANVRITIRESEVEILLS
ncbi:MAG: hypothetical protein HQ568_10285 [Calditrichaeota bacterium]|nr:hypothetical protein [Calditrichota bacterium]